MSAKPQETYSILIVEDEEKIANILLTYLNLYPKYKQVIWARDGVEAMQKLSNQEFDLIITDIVLPKRDGITFIDTLRRMPKYYHQKIMVVSGCMTADLTLKCVKRGVKHIIVKPFTARQLLVKTIGFLKAEKNPKQTVEEIIDKMARRFLIEGEDDDDDEIDYSVFDN